MRRPPPPNPSMWSRAPLSGPHRPLAARAHARVARHRAPAVFPARPPALHARPTTEFLHAQCCPFPGIGPEAKSKPVITIRIKYGIYPTKSGIYPNPPAESNVGCIPLFWHAIWLGAAASQRIVTPELMPRVGFDEQRPARQLTPLQVGGILEFAPAQPVTGEKRVHVSDNTRNGRRAPALA